MMNSCPCCGIPSTSSSAAEAPRRRRATAVKGAERATPPPTALPLGDDGRCGVLTLGHSTRPIEAFVELLRAHHVSQLIDVRTVPRSRHNPQFNTETLPSMLAAVIERVARLAVELVDEGDDGDIAQTADFEANLASLIELARGDRVAIMCAEALPWRCHRSLIADALVVHGVSTCEIASPTRLQPHKVTPFAYVQGTEITYPRAASNTSVAAHEPGSDGSDVHRRKP